MAYSQSTYPNAAASDVSLQTVTNSTATVVSAASRSLFGIKIDNIANPSEEEWLKIYDHASPTVGTTVPAVIVKIPAGVARTFIILQGNITLGSGLAYAATKTSGGVTGTADPSSALKVALAHN